MLITSFDNYLQNCLLTESQFQVQIERWNCE